MVGAYHPDEPLARPIKYIEKGQGFTRASGQTVADAMMVAFLTHTDIFND